MSRTTKDILPFRRTSNRRKGSIALEAAVSIPLMLLILVFMLSAIISCQLEAAVGAALDNTAAEISLLIPVIDLIIDSSESMQDILSELDEIDQQLAENPFVNLLFDGQVTDILSSVLFGELISQRCDYWLNDAASGQEMYLHMLDDMYIEMLWQPEDNILTLVAHMEFNTIFGVMNREVRTIVPLWTGQNRHISETDGPESNVWELDNFSRGIALREQFGAELPLSYPVIASFENGTAIAIRSMDLTAPSYQDHDNVIRAVASEITKLADFAGYPGSDKMPAIDNEMVNERKLKLIIPSNSPSFFENECLPELRELSSSLEVKLEVISYLDSNRNEA